MNYSTVDGAKTSIENAIGEIEKLMVSLDSSLLEIDNNDETLASVRNKLKSLIRELQSIEGTLLDNSLTMQKIDNNF